MEKSLVIVIATVVILIAAFLVIAVFSQGIGLFHNEIGDWSEKVKNEKSPVGDFNLEDIYKGGKEETPP